MARSMQQHCIKLHEQDLLLVSWTIDCWGFIYSNGAPDITYILAMRSFLAYGAWTPQLDHQCWS
jgi:hypothetical protein